MQAMTTGEQQTMDAFRATQVDGPGEPEWQTT
jgi:hypothetical protein